MAELAPRAAPAVTCELLYGIGQADASGHCPRAAGAKLTVTLLLVVLRAVATVTAVAACGAVLALRGALGADTQRFLSLLSMRVTIPALLFCTAASSVTPALLASAWPLTLLPFVYVPVGLALGELVVRVARPPPPMCSAVRAACALGNSTGLPVVLLTVVSDALITPAARAAFGPRLQPLAYLPLYLITYPLLQWSVGGALFGLNGAPTPATARPQQLRPIAVGPDAAADEGGLDEEADGAIEAGDSLEREALLLRPGASAAAGGSDARAAALRLAAQARALLAVACAGLLPQLASPPVMAALLGSMIGLAPRRLRLAAAISSPSSPLGWVLGAAQQLGAAAVPINLLLLGASLAAAAGDGGPAAVLAAAGGARTAAAVVVAKLVLAPLIAAAFCAVSRRAMPPMAEPYDDSVALVALLVAATPTANNVLIMAFSAGGVRGEEARRAVAALLACQYVAAPLLLTLSVATALNVIAVRV